MRILWLTNIPSPYRVDFFNELGKLCDLTVLFEKRAASDRDDSWKNFDTKNFSSIFPAGIPYGIAEAFCPGIIRHLSLKKYDRIVVTNYANLTGMLAVAVMKAKRIPYIIESDGAFSGSGKGLKEAVKRWLLEKAALCFSTSDVHDDYYKKYGVSPDRIVRYPFTSLHGADVLKEPVSKEEKSALREKLGISEPEVIIAVGQFIPRKGFDILIEAMAKTDLSVGCYIVGGVPTDEYIQQVSSLGLSDRVHFVGFKSKHELSEYYMAADLFVLPTREDIWGLVVNEAMAKGLPVITTDRCIAGLALVNSSKLGKIVPAEDAGAIADAIKEILLALNTEMSKDVLKAISAYTFEKMAEVHIEVLKEKQK